MRRPGLERPSRSRFPTARRMRYLPACSDANPHYYRRSERNTHHCTRSERHTHIKVLSQSSHAQLLLRQLSFFSWRWPWQKECRCAKAQAPASSLSSSQHLSTNMAIIAGDLVATVPGSLPTMISDWKRRTTGNTFYDRRTSASNLHK